jgi:hypothetical protein
MMRTTSTFRSPSDRLQRPLHTLPFQGLGLAIIQIIIIIMIEHSVQFSKPGTAHEPRGPSSEVISVLLLAVTSVTVGHADSYLLPVGSWSGDSRQMAGDDYRK